MLPFVSRYLTGSWISPSDDFNPAIPKGGPKWFIKKAEYLYSQYLQDRCAIPYSAVEQLQESRAYSNGKQLTTKYMDILCPKTVISDPTDSRWGQTIDERQGLYNISWDIFPIYPKFRKKIMGLFDDVDFYPCATAVDELSDDKRRGMMFGLWAQQQEKDFFQMFSQVTGVQPEQQQSTLPIEPSSIDELHMLSKMGAFKLTEEIEMEMLLNWSLNMSGRKEFKKKVIRDYVDYGRVVVQDYTDMYDGRAKVQHVPAEYAIVNYTRANGVDAITEAGQIKFLSLATLKDYGLEDKQLMQIAKSFYNQINNKGFTWNNYYEYNNVYDEKFNPMKVAILDFEFETVDTTLYRVYKKRGVDVAEVDEGDGPNVGAAPEDKVEVNTKKAGRKRWYRGKWVIGTEIIFDYGYQYDVPVDHNDVPRSSYSYYETDERSITDCAKAILDDIQIIILKLRNAEATAKPSGLLIEWGSLSDITMGKDKLAPLELMKLYGQSGTLVFRYARDKNGMPVQGAGNPIIPLVGGIGPLLNELLLSFQTKVTQLEMVTGVNDISAGAAPDPNTPVGTAQIAAAGTNDVLRNILSGYQEIMKRVDSNLALRWQHIVRFGSKEAVEGFTEAVGSHNMQVVKMTSDVSLATMGITFDAVIDSNFRMRIEQAALESMRAAKNNMPGITMNDYFVILRCMEAGQLKFAEVYLSYREKQEYDKARQTAQANSEMQAKGLQEAEQLKGQNELAVIAAKSEAKIAEIEAQGAQDRMTEALKASVAPKPEMPAVKSAAA